MSRRDRVVWCNRGWQPVLYGFCPSEKAWRRQMKRMGLKGEKYPTSDARVTFFERDGDSTAIVTVRDGAERERSLLEMVGLIVHEATHVWQHIKEHIGEVKPGDEMEAYAMQAISQELLHAFDQTRGLPGVKA